MSEQTPMHIAVEFEAKTGQLESALAKATSSAQNLTVGLEQTSAETKRTVSSFGAVATQATGVSAGLSGVAAAAGATNTGLGRLIENTGGLTRGLDSVKALTAPLTTGFAQLQTLIGAITGLTGGAATDALAGLTTGVTRLTTVIGTALLTPIGLVCTAAAGLVVGLTAVAARMVGCGTDAQSLADRLDITAENAQRLTVATAAVGVKTETAAAAIRRLSDTCADTTETGELARDAVAALGVSLTDATGTARSADHVFLDVCAALNEIPKGAARNAAAAGIFGDTWRDIAPLIDKATLAEQAYINATPFTDEAIAQSTQLNDQVAELGRRFGTAADAVVTTVGSYLIPVFLALTDGIGALFDRIAAGWSAIEPIAARIFDGITVGWSAIKPVVDSILWVCDKLDAVVGAAGKLAVTHTRLAVGLPLESSPDDPYPISKPASRMGASSVSPVQRDARPPYPSWAPPAGYPTADIDAQLRALRQLRSETDWALAHGGGKKGVVESYQFAEKRTALMSDIAAQEQKLGAAKAAILEDEKRLNTARERGEKISAKKSAEFAALRAANEKTIFEAEKALLALKKRRDALLDTAKIDLKKTLASAEPPRGATTPQNSGGGAERRTPSTVMVPPTPDSAVPGTPPPLSYSASGGNARIPIDGYADDLRKIPGLDRRYISPDKDLVETVSAFGKLYREKTSKIAAAPDSDFPGFSREEQQANREQQREFWVGEMEKNRRNVLTLIDQVASGVELSKAELANIKKMADSLNLSKEMQEASAERARLDAKNPWWQQQSPSTLLAGVTTVATGFLAASEVGRVWRGYQRANQLDTALDRLIPQNSVMTSTIDQLEAAVSGGVRSGFREVNASRPYDAYAPGGQMMGDVIVNVNSGAGGSTYNNYRLAGIVGASVLSAVATGAAGFAVAGPVGAVVGVIGGGTLAKNLGGSN